MSLVQAYISENFILMCGEQRAILSDGTVNENFKKVFKLKDTTIIGITGTIEANIVLFQSYLHIDGNVLEVSKNNHTYNEVVLNILNSYLNNKYYIDKKGVHSLVCGWDGEKMTGITIFTNDNDPSMRPINILTPEYPGHIRPVSCGLAIHRDNTMKIAQELNPKNILECKTLFKKVILEGVKIDYSINNNLTFEKIRKVDMH